MHRVIHKFIDLQDGDHLYEVGDQFPREGAEPSDERVAELAGKDNKIGRPLIAEEKAKNKPKPKKAKKSDK